MTVLVCDTPSAAVGSSMITSFALDITALATATDWRWPPDREATGWRIELIVFTVSSSSVCLALVSIVSFVEQAGSSGSWPRNMFWTMSRLSAERQVLIDRPDSLRLGIPRTMEMNGISVPYDLSLVGRPQARDRLDHDRFPGTVVSRQSRHLARRDLEIDFGQRLHRAEPLGHPAELSSVPRRAARCRPRSVAGLSECSSSSLRAMGPSGAPEGPIHTIASTDPLRSALIPAALQSAADSQSRAAPPARSCP